MARGILEKIDEMADQADLNDALMTEPQPIEPSAEEQVNRESDIIDNVLAASQVSAVDDPDVVQVAGLGDIVTGVAKGFSKRVGEAEKNVLPPLPDEPVRKVGTSTVIRQATEQEVTALEEATGGQWTKGINFPAISEGLNDYDLAEHLAKLKDANKDLFESARRGTITFDELKKLAEKQGVDNLISEWLVRTPGKGETAEKVLGGILAAMELSNQNRAAFRAASEMPFGEARDAAYAKAYQMMNVEAVLYANLSGAGSEAGRTLFALGQAQKALDVEDVAARSAELVQLFGAEGAEQIEYIGDLYMSLPSPAAKAKFVQGGLGKAMDMVIEVWINSILTAPTTHMVNVVGNAAFMATRILEQAPAVAFGAVRSALTGNPDRVRLRESIASLEGIRRGFLDAILVSGKTLFTEEPSDMMSKIDVRNRRAIGTSGDPRVIVDEIRQGNVGAAFVNLLGVHARMGGRFLLAEDEFFKGIGYRMELHKLVSVRTSTLYDELVASGKTPAEAKQMAAAEGARLLDNPPKGLVTDSRDAARVMTFQGDLDGFFADIQGGMSHPLAKLFVPFYKTPTNVMKETLIRSPMMLMYPGFYKKIMAGGREADIAFGQVATGSAIMGAFAYMSMGIDDPEIRTEQFMEMMGGKLTGATLSLVPSVSAFSAGIERMQDPTVGSTMLPEAGFFNEDPTQLPAFMRGFYIELQKAKARNPFFSDTVEPKLNLWGEKLKAGTGQGWEFWSPIRVQDTKYSPVDEELMELGDGIKMPAKRIDGVQLNAVQYNKWIITMNELDAEGKLPGDAGYNMSKTMLPMLMDFISDDNDYYQSLPTKADKIDRINAIVGKFKSASRKLLIDGDPDLAVKIMAVQ